ncbi:uncharacterized protein LOC143253008 [Tachypleus tridentatus]|uniref:uncharacterized protein LOC143253008 n=1 Tax=Tachypleus tridentatus TaxID=6853 RepID=UPI003FD4A6D4
MRYSRTCLTVGCILIWICCCFTPVRPFSRTYLDMVENINSGMVPFNGDKHVEASMIDFNRIRNKMKQDNKRTAAMGVDLPDYILHYKGGWPDLSSFRERMQKSGRR